MYLPDEELNRRCLRQGDIVTGVLFPIIDDELLVLGRIERPVIPHPTLTLLPREHRNRDDCFTAQVKMRVAPGAVLAHCCELELRNGRCLLPSVAFARVLPVKPAILSDTAKMSSLQANKDPRSTEDGGYIDYFYVHPDPRIGGGEWVVDFGQTTSVASTEYDRLTHRKILQLSSAERVKFKIKLAAYSTRLTDEERDLGLENPWR